jgi:hypothetical protein
LSICEGHTKFVYALAFSPDGKRLATSLACQGLFTHGTFHAEWRFRKVADKNDYNQRRLRPHGKPQHSSAGGKARSCASAG